MDGWQATRLIKADVRTSNIPIIARPPMRLRAIEKSVEVGCADFDTKPVDLTRLPARFKAFNENNSRSSAISHHGYLARQSTSKQRSVVMSTTDPVKLNRQHA
jgi:CheY-like chemotaxis protein